MTASPAPTTQPSPDPLRTRRRIAIRLVASQVLFALATLPVWVFIGLAKMDEPHSGLYQDAMNAAAGGYPVAVLLGTVLSWRAWRRGRFQAALRWTSLPLLWLLPMAVAWYLSWG
jgi:hypothetical protein